MDAQRFDTLTTIVASLSRTTRRSAVGLLAGLGFGVLAVTDAGARRTSGRCKPTCGECEKCKRGDCDRKNGTKKCKKGKCKPKSTGTPCTAFPGGACQNGTCVNLQADETNCGSLGTVCGPTQLCQAGACFPSSTCPASATAFTFCIAGGATCGGGCSCGRSAEGNVLCAEDDDDFCAQAGLRCTTSADCPAGRACVDVSGCCPDPAVTRGCLLPCDVPTT
jgi:hypothetical protein